MQWETTTITTTKITITTICRKQILQVQSFRQIENNPFAGDQESEYTRMREFMKHVDIIAQKKVF